MIVRPTSIRYSAFLAILLTAALARPAAAQVAIGGRAGLASGSVGALSAEINGRVRFLGRAEVRGGVFWLIQGGACPQSWPESYRCGYSGRGYHVGVSAVALTTGGLSVSAGGSVGRFARGIPSNSAHQFSGWGIGVDAEYDAPGPLLIQLGVHRRGVRDSTFDELFDESVKFTAVSIGLLLEFGPARE